MSHRYSSVSADCMAVTDTGRVYKLSQKDIGDQAGLHHCEAKCSYTAISVKRPILFISIIMNYLNVKSFYFIFIL